MPRSIANMLLALLAIALVRALFVAHYGIDLSKWELLGWLSSGPIAAFFYSILPSSAQHWTTDIAKRALFSLKATSVLAAVAGGISVLCLSVSSIRVEWKGAPSLTVEVDGRPRACEDDGVSSHAKRFFVSPFRTHSVAFSTYRRTARSYPFVQRVYGIPATIVVGASPRYTEVSDLQRLAFFQLLEARYLDRAQTAIDAIRPADESARTAVRRLDSIQHILRLSLVLTDVADAKRLLLDGFEREFPGDPWIPMLRAATAFGRRDYRAALSALGGAEDADFPRFETVLFFRGICALRLTARSAMSGTQSAPIDASDARHWFDEAARSAERAPDDAFRQVALPSALIFTGIAYFYERQLDRALDAFARAEKASGGSLKARALNDIGFVQLVKGHIDQAELALVHALEADKDFAYARSNLGLVLVARGRRADARKLFATNAGDPELRRGSHRDAVLADLELAHLGLEENGIVDSTFVAYEAALKEVGVSSFQGISPPSLRLAFIHLDLAEHVYLDSQYYGLEIMALGMYARAWLEASMVLATAPGDQRAIEVRTRAATGFESLRSMVAPAWLERKDLHGMFGAVAEYAAQQRPNDSVHAGQSR